MADLSVQWVDHPRRNRCILFDLRDTDMLDNFELFLGDYRDSNSDELVTLLV